MLKLKLLGAAFASSDLVFEIDNDGMITFALGSTQGIAASEDGSLVGQCWRNLFDSEDQYLLAALLRSLAPGERKGPLPVTLAAESHGACGRPAMLSVFRLPDREGAPVSCSLSYRAMTQWAGADQHDGLVPKEDFASATRRMMQEAQEAGLALRVDLVEFSGLDEAEAGEGGEDLRRRVSATLRANSYNGEGASELAPDRFAVLRSSTTLAADLDRQLLEASGGLVKALVAELPLNADSVDENFRALRYALDQYISDGAKAASVNFAAVVQKTAMEAVRLKSAIASRNWTLVYQPVVNLHDESLHHFEALARFEAGVSPATSICLAEELGLIADLDLAVVRMVAAALSKQPPHIEIAANLSAASLMQPQFQKALAAITERDTRLRPRLLLELTETHRLADASAANQAIQALRNLGHSVCLDDFGAGAASLDYLRQLDVDFVKFDGRYIRDLTVDSRDEVILKHMVNLCRELRIETIAEMVETQEVARLAQSIGVGLGQGWCFAKPSMDLVYPPRQAAVPSRRAGAKESWA